MRFVLVTAIRISKFHKELIFDKGTTSLALCRAVAHHDFGAFIQSDAFNQQKTSDPKDFIRSLYIALPDYVMSIASAHRRGRLENKHAHKVYRGESSVASSVTPV